LVILSVGGTKIKGKNPNKVVTNALYNRGIKALSELNKEITHDMLIKRAFSKSASATYLITI
jgi:hypothetical protein